MKTSSILENIFLSLPLLKNYHKPGSEVYTLLKQTARKEIEELFGDGGIQAVGFKPFGELVFPYYKMGAIDSLNLFDIDELIIFSFYWINRKRYHKVLDIGSNIGLHSIVLDKCGYEARSYEPDPRHFEVIQKNLSLNKCSNVQPFNSAISNKTGKSEFTRVLGNTTGSHLSGSKSNPYGDLDKFLVSTIDINSIIGWCDLVKLDAEGHEKEILLAVNHDVWPNIDVLVEIENKTNAEAVYGHFKKIGVNLFSQKNNWEKVDDVKDMPVGYREGTLFITSKSKMPW